MKKALKIIGIVFIVLWFGGNLGFYLYLKYGFNHFYAKKMGIRWYYEEELDIPKDEIEMKIEKAKLPNLFIKKVFNFIPKEVELQRHNIDAESLHLMGFKLKLPIYKNDIRLVVPVFDEHRLAQVYVFLGDRNNSKGALTITERTGKLSKASVAMYAKLSDFSWLNIYHNLQLADLLFEKAFHLGFYSDSLLSVRESNLKGFLMEGKMSTFIFESNNRFYEVTFWIYGDNKISIKPSDILTTIQPIEDIEVSHQKMETLYQDRVKTNYPKELILISMISLKGTTVDNLKELLNIMKNKNYPEFKIEEIKKEIKYLEEQAKPYS